MRETKRAVGSLQNFIKVLVKSGIKDKKNYKEWRKLKQNEKLMEKLFWHKKSGKMPSITALVGVFFHPEKPFIGLNYSPVAHNTLHSFPDGWTVPLRLCRGIVFDRKGNLTAKPFPKFFNFGENKETKNLPDETFEATEKKDGHLGIIFSYRDKFFITTRGSFESKTSVFADKMLKTIAAKNNWQAKYPKQVTILAEIIHPLTKVHIDYGKKKTFVLIGAYDVQTLKDYGYGELAELGRLLGLKVTEIRQGDSLDDLRKLMNDLSIQNKEGYVVRFKNGLRVKFKFASYINKMVEKKLGYRYLMKRIIAGNLKKMIKNLPEELYAKAQEMIENLYHAKSVSRVEKEQRKYLYELVAPEESNSGYRAVCREFLRYLNAKKHC